MNNWIRVEDEMPDKDGNYLCAFSDGSVESLTYFAHEGCFPESGHHGGKEWRVTHWHPMIPHPDFTHEEQK